MTIRGQVISETGEPLYGASVTLVNAKGDYLGEGVRTDATGKFAITSNFLNGNYVMVTYAGMEPMMLESDTLQATDYTEIILFPKLLEPVVVTPGQNENSWWWIMPVIAIGYIVTRKKRKKYRHA